MGNFAVDANLSCACFDQCVNTFLWQACVDIFRLGVFGIYFYFHCNAIGGCAIFLGFCLCFADGIIDHIAADGSV
ncbi:hypothetical protein SDC9_178706 [bioreactor metagenome]|uniref:Uncharacterized protein n=1 Tax=bioreactor metagenome TaxID=1076179 RepID=A0A645GYU2_9ZZZZ